MLRQKIEMSDTMNENTYNSIICFGGEDWWYHNRGHIDMQIMRRLAKQCTTLYINSIVMQKPNLRKNTAGGKSFLQKLTRKFRSILKGLTMTDAGFWVYSPISLPLHHISFGRAINKIILRLQLSIVSRKLGIKNPVVWVACPAACDVALSMKKSRLVYQRTDRFEDYPNVDVKTITEYDQKLKAAADLSIFVSSTLYNEESSQCKRAMYLDHGVDFDVFSNAHKITTIPGEIENIPKPIVGFFGGIDNHTSDIPLITKITELLPDFSFVFVGNSSSDCSELKAKKNVYMLGQRPYEQIPNYGKCFDVAIMPWRQNRWIAACNPIKMKEYLALGKPIVSTPFSELQKYCDVTYQARTAEDFAETIKKALDENSDEKIIARKEKVRNTSWDSKVAMVQEVLFDNNEG